MIKNLVIIWLNAGAIFSDGVLLYKRFFGDDHPFLILLKKETEAKRKILKYALRSYARRNPGDQPEPELPAHIQLEKPKPKLREDYAFLSDPDCPNELKILASNKITAYHNYKSGHQKLFDCCNVVEQLEAAKFVTENFLENRLIQKELEYYKQHKSVLADHPIFKSLKRLKELSKMSVVDLIKLRENLKHSIWRIQSEIKKGDRKHLQVERERSIKEKEFEILEITRLLTKYE